MAVYSRKLGYIFFPNPQTASKAVAKTLREKLQGKQLPQEEVVRDGVTLARRHHTTYEQILAAGLLGRKELDRIVKLTSVRNPYDLMVSRYAKRRGRFVNEPEKYPWAHANDKIKTSMDAAVEMSFPQWVQRELGERVGAGREVVGQMAFLDHADIVLRYEALQAGFNEFLARIGVTEPVLIEAYNVTTERAGGGEKKHYSSFYDDASRELVASFYAPVLTRFGYQFETAPQPAAPAEPPAAG